MHESSPVAVALVFFIPSLWVNVDFYLYPTVSSA